MHRMAFTFLMTLLGTVLSLAQPPVSTENRYDVLPAHPGAILFVGDSITDDCEWNELFDNPDILNRGIDGNHSASVLSRVHELTRHQATKLFLAVGTNDLPWNTVDQVMANVESFCDILAEESPGTKIYIQSVLPVGPRPMFMDMGDSDEKNRLIVALNERYRLFCEERGYTYIDNHSLFLSEDGKGLDPVWGSDDLHLKGSAYLVWKKNVEAFVNE